jgi:glycerophosphoryl diester phosphodiesterase
MRPLPRRADGGPLRIGHRGAAALAPDNSLAGIELALDAGLDGVEIDVVAGTGRLLVAHSPAELGPVSPALDDALALVAARAGDGFLLDLDVKTAGHEAELVAALRRHGVLGRTLVSSFHESVLRACRALEPGLPLGISYPDDRLGLGRSLPEPAIRAGLLALRAALPARIAGLVRRSGADAAMLHHLVLSRATVARCRSLGVGVFTWTVNDPDALRRVALLGVDGVIGDDPGLFRDA